MSRYQYRHGRRRRRDPGSAAAWRHVQERKTLEHRLGEALEDVTAFFYALSGARKRAFFDQYERKYGWKARQYAEKTFGSWQSGAVQMSGQTAGRLFELIPPLMSAAERQELIKRLWERSSPTSNTVVVVKRDATLSSIEREVESRLMNALGPHSIPSGLRRAYSWLHGDEAHVVEQLLNGLLQAERQQVAAELGAVLRELGPLLFPPDDSDLVHEVRHQRRIGKHTIILESERRIPERSLAGCLGLFLVCVSLLAVGKNALTLG